MRILPTSIAFAICVATGGIAQTSDPLASELATIEQQIADVQAKIVLYDGGLIKGLAEARLEALLLSKTLIENRINAESGGAIVEVTVSATQPDEVRAQQLLGEMASTQQRIDEAENEAAQGGGLVQALALSRAETEKLTLAQLQMGYLQAKYGIAFPVPAAPAAAVEPAVSESPAATAEEGTSAVSGVPWADPEFPDIDYSMAAFEQAHKEGDRISGWWAIKTEHAAVDDSLQITAVNYSAYNPSDYAGLTALVARCVEGETAFIFVQDDFLIPDFRRNTFDITLRLDDATAQQTRWNGLTSNKGAGLFGRDAEDFIRSIYESKRLFVRLTEKNGQNHDAAFDLSGGKDAFEEVAEACGWTTLSLTKDDYRAIQTLLNAGGFDTGTPDGQWGAGSKDAMKAFQISVGIPATGAPDRVTLQKLGFGG
ncbi:MAG: type VI secretion system-associated protein TagO [Paracoccaceae bacterium]